jgi:hypothetical protein
MTMHDITGLIAVIFFFTSVSAIIGSFIFTRHRERIGMIEKGLKTDEIKALYSSGPREINPLSALKWGILCVSVGMAILLGMFLHSYYGAEEGVFPGLIVLFAGIGLVLFYAIARKRAEI